MAKRQEQKPATRDDVAQRFLALAEREPLETHLDRLKWYGGEVLSCVLTCLREEYANDFFGTIRPIFEDERLNADDKLKAVELRCKEVLKDWAAKVQEQHIRPELMFWHEVEVANPPEPVEPQITPDQAVSIALQFAKAEGVREELECGRCGHSSDAELVEELGFSSGHGTYMVHLLHKRISDGTHRKTGGPKREMAMTVIVNDQTGKAQRFWQL